jgi:hypothetical protein
MQQQQGGVLMMRRFCAFGAIVCWLCAVGVEAANHVTIESKSISSGAIGATVAVYLDNDTELNGLVIPFEIREVTSNGTFPTNSLSLDAANRLTTSLIGFVVKSFYPTPDNTNPAVCAGAGYRTQGALDFSSPDGILYSTVSVGDPCLAVGSDGVPPGGTPSLVFTFDVTNTDGIFEIDTTCVTPDNHLLYVDCATSDPLVPTFTKGVITVGNPTFPPVVSDIPDQTIDEGESLTAITLDDFVTDFDHTPAQMNWTASGQNELFVSISSGHIVTIATPNPDWFGSETITFTATDPTDESGGDQAIFTVNPINDAPVLNGIPVQNVLAGNLLIFAVNGNDIDNTNLTLSMFGEPAGVSLNSNGLGSGTVQWPTGCADVGSYAVSIIVSDGSLADTAIANINVLSNPDFFAANPDTAFFLYEISGAEPSPETLLVTDPGCGELNWTATPSEPWLLVTPGNGSTPGEIVITVDTTGLTVGEYDAFVFIADQSPDKSPQAQLSIPVHVSLVEVLCDCPCVGDPVCDSTSNVLDLVVAIWKTFRGRPLDIPQDAFCPLPRVDVNCDGHENVVDVVYIASVIFRSGPRERFFCDPCDSLGTH